MATQEPTRKNVLLYLIFATTVFGLLLLGSIPAAIMTPMFFDAPEAIHSPTTWIAAIAIATLPLVCIASILFSWLSYRSRHYKRAIYLSLMPLINIVVFFLVGLLGMSV